METNAAAERVLVGEGRTAEILEWDEGRVLRLYRLGASLGTVQRELRAFRCASEAGVPSPAVYPSDTGDGLIEVDGRLGIVMERISGPTMLRQLTQRPWKLWSYARLLADLNHSMHQQSSITLPSQRERFHIVIDQLSGQLDPKLLALLHQTLDRLDDGNAICHGDFHPDNVILSDRGPVIIDWGPASAGAPAADVAWTVYLFKHGGTPPGMSRGQRVVLSTLRRLFLKSYCRNYMRLSSMRQRMIKQWAPVIAAIRLGDGIPEEEEGLLQTLRTFEARQVRRSRQRHADRGV